SIPSVVNEIGAGACRERVAAETGKRLRTAAADQQAVSGAQIVLELTTSGAAVEGVRSTAGDQGVHAATAEDQIAPRVALQLIGTATPIDRGLSAGTRAIDDRSDLGSSAVADVDEVAPASAVDHGSAITAVDHR